MSSIINCIECHKKFVAHGQRVNFAKFCSMACKKSNGMKGRTFNCTQCGNVFVMPPGSSHKYKFCGQKCYFENKRIPTDIDSLAKQLKFNSITKKNECIEWTGAKSASGYGVMNRGNKLLLTHRVSYQINFGSIPEGKFICHSCDNPPCFNPKHLFLGSSKDNSDDRDKKDRVRHGEPHPFSKLTEKDVRHIRSNYDPKIITLRTLAKKYGVSSATIYNVLSGKTWKRVV